MRVQVLAGSAHPALAESVCAHLGVPLACCKIDRFPDGEVQVELVDSVRGADVYIIQPTGPPGENLIELLLLADACRRSGAFRMTAAVTYLGYARQDRRARGREPIAARVIGDVLGVAGFARIVAIDLHDAALEGFFPVPVEHLSAATLLAETIRPMLIGPTVVVAPDLGAIKLAERYAHVLGMPVAILHKTRLGGDHVTVEHVVGDVVNRMPLIVDDIITTAGTIEAAARALFERGSLRSIAVAATHALLVGAAMERLRRLPIRAMAVTDTLARPSAERLPLQVVSVADLLARAIDRLSKEQSMANLVIHE